MYGPRFDEADIRDLAVKWNANQIRWQLNWTPMKQAEEWAQDLDAYDRWLDSALVECDRALDACDKYGIKVLVDLHTPPGGRAEGGVCRMFQEQRYQDKLIEVWDRIARRYRERQVVYAYDLLNEAVEGIVADGLLDWRDLATKATRTIRAVDPCKPVVFEPSPWGGPDGFDFLEPLDLDRVIYSFHMYRPHSFTHQGVSNNRVGISYPGRIDGQFWDKEALREAMRPAIEFQQAYNVHIYVGEFSAIRWAPGDSAYNYLRDVIDLLEHYGWDWSYHAFREWDGWSVEHGPDRTDRRPPETPTPRMQLLLRWFARNQRPGAEPSP
jgi:endoglucanase